jgi:MarR family transcriptional regulator, organic hydroperoxide resistance regulator
MKDKPIEDSLSFLLVQLVRGHHRRIADTLRELGLYVGQEMIMSQLWEKEGVAQTQLADACGLEKPTITKIMERMSEAGLIRVEKDQKDRRVRRVYLTERGRSLKGEVRRRWYLVEDQLFKGLSERDKSDFRQFLERMRANMYPGEESIRQAAKIAR